MELVNNTPLNSRKRTWKFYNDCDFLRPHVELFRLDETATTVTKKEDSPVSSTIKGKSGQSMITSTGMVRCEYTNKNSSSTTSTAPTTFKLLVQNDEDEDTEYQLFEANEAGELQEVRTISDDSHLQGYGEYEQETEEYEEVEEAEKLVKNTIKPIDVIEVPKKQVTDDPDEKFLMSCLPVLKRLSNKKNALLKLKIQTLLFEVEFGDEDDDVSRRKRAKI